MSEDSDLLYNLEDRPPLNRTLAYAVQWLGFTLANSAVLPIVVGSALGLDQAGIAGLAQRTFFFQALASLLQVCFGHRLPIIEGPSGMWWGIFITLAAMAPGLGKPLSLLRTDLEFGVMAAGLILVLVGATGLIGKTLKLFTPAVTGSVLVLLGLQLSGAFVKGMFGIGSSGGSIDLKSAIVSLIVVAMVVVINLKARGFFKSIAILIGIAAGWVIAVLAGVPSGEFITQDAVVAFPKIFAWGTPTFDPGIVFVSVLTGLLVLSNLVASILAMERVLKIELPQKSYNRGVIFTGMADVLAGLGATVGFVPYSAGAGMVSLTRVAARLPFIIFAIALIILGLLPQVGAFLASIPEPVGYSVLLASFCQMLGFGLKDYTRLEFNARDYFVVGLPILFGTGVMNLPGGSFGGIPVFAQYILGNGFIAGMLLCMLLEHVLLPKKYFS
ncbi:uracil-xanthine permease family protein [Pelotomaculum propionicicum]|uniref:Putative purine permease YwdJ n=1 Tax=Pelotomaculum propionicicum TaxID=258475 RepID=A0A4Y7RJA5_9FIRM|nr:purine/pyrimidine permease [Pelotomaculum propionicicum]TEB08782.1 putative purine permease YwdJ [Pelotomaculum propionicicum]